MKAHEFLYKAASLLEERGKEYDKPEGERSMARTVTAFNAITGRDLSESDGWLLLQVLKDVRQWQNPGRYHQDSAEDCISYAALKAEALAGQERHAYGEFTDPFVEPASLIDDESPRAMAIGQNGNDGSHYGVAEVKPDWRDAPSWATHLMRRHTGTYEWASYCDGNFYDGPDGDCCEFILSTAENPSWDVIEARPC